MLKKPLLAALVLSASSIAFGQSGGGPKEAVPTPEKGWFFFEDPPKQEEPVKEEPPKPSKPEPPPEEKKPIDFPKELPPAPKEDKCKKKETWDVECGFVDPGEDFQFQAKQRDALLERLSVAKNNPKAVEAFQYYMRWVLERTSEVTNLWWYNMVQNPELDPNVTAPISTFGLRLMTDVQKGHAEEIFNLIKSEGGFFIYFSRSDCNFCHQMTEVLVRLSLETGLEIRNAALDDKCMPHFEKGCRTAPVTHPPAQALQVATVPALFLYIKPNTWLRIATGVVDLESIKTRTIQFFSAYRAALMNGVENAEKGRPSVDFSGADPKGSSKGIAGAMDGGSRRLPSEDELSKLLGGGKK